MDEMYIKVKGPWRYLYRAVDKAGYTIDLLFRAKRDKAAASRFFSAGHDTKLQVIRCARTCSGESRKFAETIA